MKIRSALRYCQITVIEPENDVINEKQEDVFSQICLYLEKNPGGVTEEVIGKQFKLDESEVRRLFYQNPKKVYGIPQGYRISKWYLKEENNSIKKLPDTSVEKNNRSGDIKKRSVPLSKLSKGCRKTYNMLKRPLKSREVLEIF